MQNVEPGLNSAPQYWHVLFPGDSPTGVAEDAGLAAEGSLAGDGADAGVAAVAGLASAGGL